MEIFGQYDLPEDSGVEATPYPRLVDTPTAPAQGEYTAAVPDPARGKAVEQQLAAEAAIANVRARELSGPVIEPAERERMLRRSRRRQP